MGNLRLTLPSGDTISRGRAGDTLKADIEIHRWRGLRRMLAGELGFTAGYLDGDWSTSDLASLLELCIRNEDVLRQRRSVAMLAHLGHKLAHLARANTRRGSRRNISAHYDLGNAFYSAWLDEGMNYSSGLYRRGNETLEEAQEIKLARAIELLDVANGEDVLEIGCGWGGLAEKLAKAGCPVTGITLSKEQLDHAKDRLASHARAEMRLEDYREHIGVHDRIVSIEMLEAVGERYWPLYFRKLRDSLRDGGVAVLQAITIEEARFEDYRRYPDFIQQHIFPGGMLPTVSIVTREAAKAGLRLVQQESFGPSYARTLAEWRKRFVEAWPRLKPLGFDERFRRLWEYYLVYCETGFKTGSIDVSLFKLTADGNLNTDAAS
ncbi:SAM-dependent methyltransferase [Methyloligella halotolerans]|uniref:SAM-dependent methyltransferase n=1 Tax=Methyloligella halotolerans TaxID=1177755 RepID=UPI001FD94D30|nr:cyclopropane-fatty-acyl-phospholipid synthase family protein [Methyloligella halotolerans]